MDKRTEKILAIFDRMETERTAKFGPLATTGQDLNRQPAPNSWSVAQVGLHLLDAETNTLAYVKKKIQSQKLGSPGMASWFRLQLLKLAFALGLKYKMPKVLTGPDAAVSYVDAMQAWAAKRQELRAYLAALPPDVLDKELFKHPFAGRMNLYHAIEFMRAHQGHHFLQVDRILAVVGKKG